jgi:hypothetical protein
MREQSDKQQTQCGAYVRDCMMEIWLEAHRALIGPGAPSPLCSGYRAPIIIIIQFSSCLFTCSSTAQRPITELAGVKEGKQEIIQTKKLNFKIMK